MTRGTGNQSKVHYQGKEDDFIVYIESAKAVQDWVKDRSIPLAQVVDSFKVFVTHKHGAQGVNDEASKQTLENEFGTHNADECITKILEAGSVQETGSAERQGPKNDSMGSRAAH